MKFISSSNLTVSALLASRAFQYGEGLFETMRWNKGCVPLWEFHFKRLQEGCLKLGVHSPSEKEVTEKLDSLKLGDESFVIKLMVFRKERSRGYQAQSDQTEFVIIVSPFQQIPACHELKVSTHPLSLQPQLAGLKHMNRIEQTEAARSLAGSGFQDALMCDPQGNVIETTYKNVLFIKNEQVHTPLLDKAGVYGVALRWLQQQDFKIEFKDIALKDLQQYDSMLSCNSLRGFQEIKKIEDRFQFENSSKLISEICSKWDQLFK